MPDEVVSTVGDIDTDALLADFEAEYTEEESEPETDAIEEPSAQEEPGEQGDGETEADETGEDLANEQHNDPDLHKRNEAFKRQREEIKELERYRDLVMKMAKDGGFEDPNEIFTAYETQNLEREAEERGIDLETMMEIDNLRRQREQEELNARQQSFQEELNATVEKYNLSEDDVKAVYDFVQENGYQELGFEQAYKLANYDMIVEKARNEGRQNYLSDKKQRQKSAAINPGSNNVSNPDVATDGLSDDEFNQLLKSTGVNLFD